MKTEWINPIVQSTFDVLEEILAADISRGKLQEHTGALPLHRVSVLAGLNGTIEGTVLLSMPLDVVLSIAAIIAGQEVEALDGVAQAAVIGLMDTIMQEALQRFAHAHPELSVRATPAVLFWGHGIQWSCTEIEAAVIPLKMPLGTVELAVGLRETPEPIRSGY
jgi:CheY-specific phosphatase CheX